MSVYFGRVPKGNVFVCLCVSECVWMKENPVSRWCMTVHNVNNKVNIGEYLG